MKMHVENGLTCVAPGIHQETVSALFDAQFACNSSCSVKEFEQDLFVFCPKIIQRVRDMTARNNQYMLWCLWLDILKSQYIFILVDSLSWYLACSDSTE